MTNSVAGFEIPYVESSEESCAYNTEFRCLSPNCIHDTWRLTPDSSLKNGGLLKNGDGQRCPRAAELHDVDSTNDPAWDSEASHHFSTSF